MARNPRKRKGRRGAGSAQGTAVVRNWWHGGIRFACQGSGKCCVSRGAYGYVYLTLADRRRLASAHGLPTREFTRKFCAKSEGLFHLVDEGAQCRFLSGNRCSVYESRPTQCRTWPFWPENMSAKAWTASVRTPQRVSEAEAPAPVRP
jgi:hypothetical protein